jgi:hypothetical protein
VSVAVAVIVGAPAVDSAVDVGVANGLRVADGVATSRVLTSAGGVPVKVATSVGAGDGLTGVAGVGFFPPQAASEIATIRSKTKCLTGKR